MAGEYTIATKLVADAVKEAKDTHSMCPETMANALLGQVLSQMSRNKTRADVESYINFELDNLGGEFMIATRGC
jgi:hypothetical protein